MNRTEIRRQAPWTAVAGRLSRASRPHVAVLPATLVILAGVILAGAYTARLSAAQHAMLLERIGTDVDGFDARRILTLPLATFIQSSPGVDWPMLLLVGAPLVLLESATGSVRAAAIWLLSDWISAPITLLAMWGLAQLGSQAARQLLDVADAGSSAASHGAIAAVCLTLPGRLRPVAVTGLFGIDLFAFTFERIDAAVAHLVASAVGIGLGWLLLRRHATATPTHGAGAGAPSADGESRGR